MFPDEVAFSYRFLSHKFQPGINIILNYFNNLENIPNNVYNCRIKCFRFYNDYPSMEKNSDFLDAVDLKILRLLQEDATLTNKQLAARLDLTVTPVFERVKKLNREGFIRKYVAMLDRRKNGFELLVFCEVSIKEHNKQYLKKFEKEVKDLPEVMECHHVTGAFDYLLKIVVSSMDKYQHFIKEKLAGIDHIGRVESHFVMSEIKNSTALPV